MKERKKKRKSASSKGGRTRYKEKKTRGRNKNIIKRGYPVVKPMILKKKRIRRVSKKADYCKSVFD